MAYCELCDLPFDQCHHGHQARKAVASADAPLLLISPKGIAHFPGCPHKGADDDHRRWAEVDTRGAWRLMAVGDQLPATGGGRDSLVATTRCVHCVEHGPW